MTRYGGLRTVLVMVGVLALFAPSATAQGDASPPAQPPLIDPQPRPQPAETDLMVINLPTTLSMREHGSYFRLTHRFERDLRAGTLGQLASDLFSLDGGSIIELEYRYAFTGRLQAGLSRSRLLRTMEVFGRFDLWHQDERLPVGVSISGSFEGENNFREHHQPGVGLTVSRTRGDVIAVYATPQYVVNTLAPGSLGAPSGKGTFYLGLATRLRFRPTAFVVAEVSPRLGGYEQDRAAWNLGVEKHTRGHVLQLNFGNNFANTPGQLARGGSTHDVYMGFNLSRKFF